VSILPNKWLISIKFESKKVRTNIGLIWYGYHKWYMNMDQRRIQVSKAMAVVIAEKYNMIKQGYFRKVCC
jgi:hypothetical protein